MCGVRFSRDDHKVWNFFYSATRSTSKVTWSEGMNFGDTQTYAVYDLGGFCLRGLDLRIVEEKVQSTLNFRSGPGP